MNKQISSKKAIFAIVLTAILTATATGVAIAQSPAYYQVITSGEYAGAPRVTVFIDGSTYYAKSAYGSIIDASTNASKVVASAFNALTGGRTHQETVQIKGAITLTNSIVPPSYTYLDLKEAQLTASNIQPIVTYSGKQYGGVITLPQNGTTISIVGGYIDGNSAGQTNKALNVAGIYAPMYCDTVEIKDTVIDDALWCGICVEGSFAKSTIDGVEIKNSCGSSTSVDLPHAIYTLIPQEQTIKNCYIHNNDCTGGDVKIAPYDDTYNFEFINNRIVDFNDYGVLFVNAQPYSFIGTNVKISGNTIKNGADAGSIGIYVFAENDSAVLNGLSIENNYIENLGYIGIDVSMNGTTSGIIIANNIIHNLQTGGASSGIVLESNTRFARVFGNYIFDSQGSPQMQYGIREITPADYNQFLDNTVQNCQTKGILCDGVYSFVRRNVGYVTEYQGTAIISAGQTSVNVTHNLSGIPTTIILTGTWTDFIQLYATDATSTQFTANVASAPSGDRLLYWSAYLRR